MFGRLGRNVCPKISVLNGPGSRGSPITSDYCSHIELFRVAIKRSSSTACSAFFIRRKHNAWSSRNCYSQTPNVTFASKATTKSEIEQVQDVNDSSTQDPLPVGDDSGTEYTLELTEEELRELTQGDPELIKKVKYIQLEHEVYRQEGMKVPSRVKLSQWKELLQLPSPSGRRKYYNFLFLNEMKSENDRIKKQHKKEARLQFIEESGGWWGPREDDPHGVIYGLGRNTLFLRLYDTSVARFHHNKVTQAMRFGRPIVLDCGYEEFMNPREAKNCAKQIEIMLTLNRTHNQPFDLHLCNARRDSRVMEYLVKIIPTLYDDGYPLHITEQSYLDIFPKKELVYLTPHAKDELEEYDENEIYIIGGMVDKSDPRPFSLAKAKKENVRMKKLPLDQHLIWGEGNKSLTLNQMISIMLDLRLHKDWKIALDHVPKRKLNRNFHPYPNQILDGGHFEPPNFRQPSRRENKSQVLEDFELHNRRKGFKGGFERKDENYRVRSNNNFQQNCSRSRISARNLFEE